MYRFKSTRLVEMKPSSLSFRALEFYGTRIRHRGQWRIHRQLRKLLNADLDCELQVERAGLRWNLNPSEFTQNSLFWLGSVDHWEFWHAKRLVKPGSVIFDVGANFGFYSLALASFLKRDCRVFAVEPHPVTRERLLSNIALNSMEEIITVIPSGFSERKESAYMSGYSPDHTGGAYCSSDPSGTPVTMTTLDEVAETYKLSRLDFLKIDVEGYEERALRGGESTLRRFRPALLVECIDGQLRRGGSSAQQLSAYLRSLGYRFYVAERKNLVSAAENPSGDSLNVICLP